MILFNRSLLTFAEISNTVKRLWTKPYTGANVDTLNKIAEALGVTVNDLIENVPNEK